MPDSWRPRDYSTWKPWAIPTAIVWAQCEHHEFEQLAAWATFLDGRILIWESRGWREEFVGDYAPDAADQERLRAEAAERGGRLLAGFAVAKPAPGDSEHHREIITCPRPSCPYRVELGQPGVALVRELVRGLATANGNRTESDPSLTPAYVLELNGLLREPDRTFRDAGVSRSAERPDLA